MYLDPGSWSMVLQVLAGVVISGLTLVGIYWSRIKERFSKKKEVNKEVQ